MPVLEFDDFPRGGRDFLRMADRLAGKYPHFRCNVFAIPREMTKRWHARVASRPHLRLYPHGMAHEKGECRLPPNASTRRLLRRLRGDDRWHQVFKAPRHGYCPEFIEYLEEHGFAVAVTNLHGFPYPVPRHWRMWSHRCEMASVISERGHVHRGEFVEAHPCYRPRLAGATKSKMSKRNVRWWSQAWSEDSHWAWVDDLLRPALTKIHLGCGPHAWDGWMNLDPRTSLDPRIISWDWSRLIPCSDNKADIVFSSHTLNYLEEDRYAEAFLDIWRVLRPGGIYRLSEDDTDSGYIWRKPGQRAAGTGTIRSLPTKSAILAALEKVGFKPVRKGYVIDAAETASPHLDVLKGNSRSGRTRRGHKFYAEVIKDPSISVSNVRRTDPRARIKGRYCLP